MKLFIHKQFFGADDYLWCVNEFTTNKWGERVLGRYRYFSPTWEGAIRFVMNRNYFTINSEAMQGAK